MGIFSRPTLDIRSQSGFTILYERYGSFVFSVCNRYIQDSEASHSITAEIFTSIWERRETLYKESVGKKSWKPYLSQAAKQQAFNHLRIKKQLEIYFSRTSDHFKTATNSTEQELEFDELANQIDELIHELPPKCQEVFRLSREKGQSNKEIQKIFL